jgi:hypothetical protein
VHCQLHLFLPKRSFLSVKFENRCQFEPTKNCEYTVMVSQKPVCQTVEYDDTLECDNFWYAKKNMCGPLGPSQ